MVTAGYLVVLVVGWLALGPWWLVAMIALLVVPRARRALRPSWRFAAGVALLATVTALTVALLPDGSLPLPPGPGLLVSPAFEGEPAEPSPVELRVPRHPYLAPAGRSSMHSDAWASDTYTWAGPLGRSTVVDTAWFGIEECATLAFTSDDRLVALCGSLSGPALHLLDPESMRKLATMDLPPRPSGRDKPPWADLCGGAYFYLDHRDRAVVATTDRRILVVDTTPGDDPALRRVDGYDLTSEVPPDDCLVALLPGWDGTVWFVTEQGRVGTVDPRSKAVATVSLGEEIANTFAVDEDGGVFVVTDTALHRLDTGPSLTPRVTWRSRYDRGTRVKPGQFTRGSGTTPTVLPGGLVVITDNAEPRMNVVVYRTDNGAEVCRVPVLAAGASATENSLVSVGDGVIVENNHGYASPLSTVLGRTTTPGLARVDVSAGGCSLAWESDEVAPTSVPKVSLANGLVYVYTTRRSRWLVNAWYLTAIDVRTGRTAFSVRTGTGMLANNHYAAVTLAPDGSAYIATLGGLVRVRG